MFQRMIALVLASVLAILAASAQAAPTPPPVEAYGRLPAIDLVSLSPSGQRYALIMVVKDARKLVVLNATDHKVLLASDLGQAKVVNLTWAGEDHLLTTISHTVPLEIGFTASKAELQTVIATNVPAAKSFAIFSGHSGVSNAVMGTYGVAQIGGRWYGFFGAFTYADDGEGFHRLDNSWPDLYRVDLETGEIEIAAHGDALVDEWLVGPEGAVIARTTYDSGTGDWQVLAGGSGRKVLAAGRSQLGGVGSLSRGRTADSIVFDRPDSDDNGYALQEVSLTPGVAQKPVLSDDVGVIEDPVSRMWIGVVHRGDQPTPEFFSPVAQARVLGAFKAFPDEWIELESFTSDLTHIIVRTSGAGDSGTYWVIDIATHAAVPLGREYPGVPDEAVGSIQMIDWKAADGLALRGVLSLPAGREAKNLPVIVMPHGGPESRDYPKFDWWAQIFASHGYAVFQPNFRGSSGYGYAFRNAGFGEYGRKMQTDVSDGLAALAKQGIVDPKRACIAGWSYGGYVAQAGVTLQHGLYRCAVSMAGLSDLSAFLAHERYLSGQDGEAVRYWLKFMGTKTYFETELPSLSPARQAAQAGAPLLLIHGKDDTVVPIEQSQKMERAMRAADKSVELVTLPGADHWLLHEETRLDMARSSLDFVLKYNPPDAVAAPAP